MDSDLDLLPGCPSRLTLTWSRWNITFQIGSAVKSGRTRGNEQKKKKESCEQRIDPFLHGEDDEPQHGTMIVMIGTTAVVLAKIRNAAMRDNETIIGRRNPEEVAGIPTVKSPDREGMLETWDGVIHAGRCGRYRRHDPLDHDRDPLG